MSAFSLVAEEFAIPSVFEFFFLVLLDRAAMVDGACLTNLFLAGISAKSCAEENIEGYILENIEGSIVGSMIYKVQRTIQTF